MVSAYQKGNEKPVLKGSKRHGACPRPSPGVTNVSEFFATQRKMWTRNLAMTRNDRR